MTHPMPTGPGRPHRLAAAADHLAAATLSLVTHSPAESARLAWVPGGPSLAELETRIREHIGLPVADAA